MHNWISRGNAVFGFFTSVVMAIILVLSLTTVFQMNAISPLVTLSVPSIQVRNGRFGLYYDYKAPSAQLANIHFNLEADLSPLFKWNTKQLFVYLVAEYSTMEHVYFKVT